MPIDALSNDAPVDREYLSKLLELLKRGFDEEELKELCFSLDVDYYDLSAVSRAGKAVELITHLDRRGGIPQLVQKIRELRPKLAKGLQRPLPSSKSAALEQFPPRYDVFLSYALDEIDVAEDIAKELDKAGIMVRWEPCPGQTWLEYLKEGLDESKSMLMLIGEAGSDAWMSEQVQPLLEEYVKKGRTIIPTILPGLARPPRLPRFFDQRSAVNCRMTQISHQSLDKLIWGITGRRPSRSISQIGDEFSLAFKYPKGLARTIKLYTLPNPDTGRLLDLTWETFGRGINRLQEQVKSMGFHLDIAACFGINDAGLIMAAFLQKAFDIPPLIGYIRCGGTPKGRRIFEDATLFPDLPPKPTILLADFELKTGSALTLIVDRIRKQYDTSRIYFAAFGAMVMTRGDTLRIHNLNQLRAFKNLSRLDIEDIFIAFTMHEPGIEPPLGLR